MVERGRWEYRLFLTASRKRSSKRIWSLSWKSIFIRTHTDIGPETPPWTLWVWRASDADATTGRSIWTSEPTLIQFRTSFYYGRSGSTRTVPGCCYTSSGGSKLPCSWKTVLSNLGRRAVHRVLLFHPCWLICSFIIRSTGGWPNTIRTYRLSVLLTISSAIAAASNKREA